MSAPVWLLRSAVDAMHDKQLTEHGGARGIRDEGLLESALSRAANAHAYGETDLCALAANYAFGIARNHPYIDGNKRTAFLAAYTFLGLNGLRLIADEDDVVETMLAVAAGEMDEKTFAAWLRANTG